MTARYRAEHVGSLLRPPEVLEAHAAQSRGEITPGAASRDRRPRHPRWRWTFSRHAGLDVLSDGEYRRASWAGEFADAMDGYVAADPPIQFTGACQNGQERAPELVMQDIRTMVGQGDSVIGEKLRQRRRLTGHEVELPEAARRRARSRSPCPRRPTWSRAATSPGVTDKAYGSPRGPAAGGGEDLPGRDPGACERGRAVHSARQSALPGLHRGGRREQWRAIGIDPEQALLEDIAADNACIAGIDRCKGDASATHICRGNGRSAWHSEGGYERIAEPVFGGLDVDRFLLEYDSERAGGFEPLRFMPKGKTVVLGLITTKSGDLESRRTLLQRRIEEAAKYMSARGPGAQPAVRVRVDAQGNLLSWDEQRRKLELVAETARKVWG